MYDSIHEKVKKNFEIEHWKENYNKAVSHRAATHDTIANHCNKIRANHIPEDNVMPNIPNYDGKFYKDGLTSKQIEWRVSQQMAGELLFNLESVSGLRDANVELFEEELNHIASEMGIIQEVSHALYDMYYLGDGFLYLWWDKKAISEGYITGRPRIQYVHAEEMYLDPSIQHPDKTDKRYIFRKKKRYHMDLAVEYPKYKDKFKECADTNGLVEVVIVQFKHTEEVECVTITDEGRRPPKRWILPLEDLNQEECGELDEDLDISFPYPARKEFWYEAIFVPEIDLVIKTPEFVGETCSYHIFSYRARKDSAYSYGLAYFIKDYDEIQSLILTMAIINGFKHHKNEKIVEGSSLTNQSEYIANSWKIGVTPEVDPEWRREFPTLDAVKNLEVPQFPQALPFLANMLSDSAKNRGGALDTMTGHVPFAGISGTAMSLHQTAGQVFFKEPHIRFQFRLSDIGNHLKWLVAEFMDFPHWVTHLNENNEQEELLVNCPEESPFSFEPERVNVTCVMYEDPEMLKQLKRDLALTLHKMGLMGSRRTLEEMPFSNPDKIHEEAQHERGIMQIMNFLENNPQVQEQLQQMMQSQQSNNK